MDPHLGRLASSLGNPDHRGRWNLPKSRDPRKRNTTSLCVHKTNVE